MNENLHDIDKLFKDGLDGHIEDLPPSVWDGVSHNLDKKQAAHYRDKYYRLKRAALLVLLFAFIGGAGLVYYTITRKVPGQSPAENTPSATTANITQKETSLPTTKAEKSSNDEEAIATDKKNNQPIAADTSIKKLSIADKEKEGITVNEEKKDAVVNDQNKNDTTVTNKGKIVVTNDEHQKQLRKKNITSHISSKGRANRFFINQPTQTRTITQNKKLQTTNIPSENFYPNRKMEALLHSSFPVIDIRKLSPDRTNVAQAKSKALARAKTKASPVFSLTAFAAPNINFGRLEDDKRLSGPGRNRQEVHKEEQTSYSFSGGLLLNYELSKKLTLQSGVTVTSSSSSISPKIIYAKPDNNGRTRYELHCSSGYSYITPKNGAQPAVGDSVNTSGTKSKLTYVSIPASISLRVGKGKFSLNPSIGAGLNFLTAGNTETMLSNAPASESAVTTINGLKSTYLDGRIAIGAEYEMNKKFSISLRPNARLALTPINRETPVKSYQNYLSLEAGIKIKL